jgi:Asp/Glu/hydantoin racemase
MSNTLALIHTVGELVPTFKALCADMIPEIDCFHVVDEGVVRTIASNGEITPRTVRRLADLVTRAEDDGARLILLTCSTVSPTLDLVAAQVSVPVLKIDEAMADLAVQMGKKIGVLATARSAMHPVSELVRSRAELAGRSIEVRPLLLEGAIQSLQAGDAATHDSRVIAGIQELGTWADVVVLAQGSMARALDGLPEEKRPCPVLTNARLGLARAAEILRQTAE